MSKCGLAVRLTARSDNCFMFALFCNVALFIRTDEQWYRHEGGIIIGGRNKGPRI